MEIHHFVYFKAKAHGSLFQNWHTKFHLDSQKDLSHTSSICSLMFHFPTSFTFAVSLDCNCQVTSLFLSPFAPEQPANNPEFPVISSVPQNCFPVATSLLQLPLLHTAYYVRNACSSNMVFKKKFRGVVQVLRNIQGGEKDQSNAYVRNIYTRDSVLRTLYFTNKCCVFLIHYLHRLN